MRREHDDNDDDSCWCTPTVIPVECDDGSIGWVVAHRGSDHQTPEQEADRGSDHQTPEQEADRAVCIAEAIDAVKRGG